MHSTASITRSTRSSARSRTSCSSAPGSSSWRPSSTNTDAVPSPQSGGNIIVIISIHIVFFSCTGSFSKVVLSQGGCKIGISPIFYYGKSPKTNEKYLKIPNLQPPDWGRLFWMTLYFIFINFSLSTFILFLDVSPPSIVECMYVGNYYLSLTSASDQRQCKLAQGTRSRSERVVHGRRCRLCILDSILQQWQFAAA